MHLAIGVAGVMRCSSKEVAVGEGTAPARRHGPRRPGGRGPRRWRDGMPAPTTRTFMGLGSGVGVAWGRGVAGVGRGVEGGSVGRAYVRALRWVTPTDPPPQGGRGRGAREGGDFHFGRLGSRHPPPPRPSPLEGEGGVGGVQALDIAAPHFTPPPAPPPPSLSRAPSRVQPREAREAQLLEIAKEQRPSITRSRMAWPVAGERPKPTEDIVQRVRLPGLAIRSKTGPAVRRVLDEAGPGADDAGVGGLRSSSATRRARLRKRRPSTGGGGGRPPPAGRATRAGRRRRRDCRAASGGRRGRCRRRRRSASTAAVP